ncbi:MAG: hypothetical protein LBV69_04100 [Bacteroidales bacterium]|jgi:hypothetical protein|nr:hypothetical protein [Bacteroidales bacterium]
MIELNRKTLNKIIEILWILIGLFSIGVSIYVFIKLGKNFHDFRVIICFFLGIISICMSFLRRMQRKNEENKKNRRSINLKRNIPEDKPEIDDDYLTK